MARTPPRRTAASKTSGKRAKSAPAARKSARSAPAKKKAGATKPKLKAQAKKTTRPARNSKRPARAKQPIAPAPVVAENPRALALAHTVAQQALDVLILDVRGKTSYADYVVIASGESDRQVGATAEAIRAEIKGTQGLSPIGSEGFETGNWVLLDYGEVVVHLFLQEARAFYDLEGLWADAAREKVA